MINIDPRIREYNDYGSYYLKDLYKKFRKISKVVRKRDNFLP